MSVRFLNDANYITNLKNTSDGFIDSSYIVSRENLRTILNNICNELKHPVTIINVNYDDEASYTNGRVDSDASYYALRPTCRNLRIAAMEDYCMKCDEYYAKCCKELIENGSCSLETLEFFSDVCKYEKLSLQEINTMSYLVYDCPMLGYCEMCFPIYFHGKIIGIMIVGEILLTEKKQRKINIMEDFFRKQNLVNNPKSIFREYDMELQEKRGRRFNFDCLKENELDTNTILEDFRDNASLCKTDFKNVLTSVEFNSLISQCYQEVKKLEKILENKWNDRKRAYFENIIKKIRNKFNDRYYTIRAANEITYVQIQEMFEAIWMTIIEIKKEFSFDYCRLYENLQHITQVDFKEKTDDTGICPYGELKYDFTRIALSVSQCKNSLEESDENNPLFCFNDNTEIDGTKNVVLACENLAVMFGVSEYNLEVFSNLEHLKILFQEISRMFLHICADLERVSALFIQQQHENTLHMYRHECAHLAQRIQQNNEYYSKRERYENLSLEKKENIYRDIDSTVLSLQHLSTNIGALLGSISKEKIEQKYSYIDLRDIFNKWRSMFRLELRKKKLRMLNSTAFIDDYLLFNTHEELFEIMLYNLIDNAVKYSYWGTNICVKITPDKVIVRDYGISIEEGSRPYDLYYRSKKNDKSYLGDGIGLYSSKKVAEILNLGLSHTCEKISEYNLPFVREALYRNLPLDGCNIDIDKASREIKLFNRMDVFTPDNYYRSEDVSYYSVPKRKLYRDISMPTYCVTFTIKGLNK